MLPDGAGAIYASGACEIDLVRRELRVLGAPTPVGGRAFEIIELLARSAGEIVTKDELLDRVWPGAIVTDNTLQVHAVAIRKALGPYRTLLKTESGRGYRLLGEWTVRASDPARPPAGLHPMQPGGGVPAPGATTNFPAAVTSLVGREAAVARLRDLVSAYRAVTLTGPGGIGKSTLALEVASGIAGDFADGAWLVELASLADPALVPSAVAGALGLKLGEGPISAEIVARALAGRQLLLILDNCEHLIEAAAELAERLVRACPRVTLLATSREILRIDGETVYRVPPLEVPAPGQDEPDQILANSAVALFIARAKASNAAFALPAAALPAVGAICRRLDGIPLAIEFAAARAAVLGVEEVARDLRDRLTALSGGRRTAVARHRTLQAALDWSYDLLAPAEQLLLRRLAIFPAGFTLEAAAAVVGGGAMTSAAVRDGIGGLIAKSLVAFEETEPPVRWRLLETIRAYALQKLAAAGEAEAAARLQAAWLRDAIAPAADGARLAPAELARHVREIDNVRAALAWCFSAEGDTAIGIDLTAAFIPVWAHLSLVAECCDCCERALRATPPDAPRDAWPQLWLRIGLGSSSLFSPAGPSDLARTALREAVEIAGALNDLDAQARALSALGTVLTHRGDYAEAFAAVEQLRAVAAAIGDPLLAVIADRNLGTRLVAAGQPREAQRHLERVLRAPVTAYDPRRSSWRHSEQCAMARAMLARALWQQGFLDQARAEALASLDDLAPTDHQLSLCRVLYYGICRIAPMTGDHATAARMNALLAETAGRLNAGFWMTAAHFLDGKLMVERADYTAALALLRSAFETCRHTGWSISHAEFTGALALALAGTGRPEEALAAVEAAIASTGEGDRGQGWYVPELLRIKGEFLRAADADAEPVFRAAAALAGEQGALFWELRIALSLARLRLAQDRGAEARRVLAPVFARFTEGFDTADLLAARALLDSLPPG